MKRLWLLLIALTLLAPTLLAQTSGRVPSRDAGADNSGDEPFDIPELYGSTVFARGQATRLPALLAEYAVTAGAVYERISLFDNGVASIHIAGRDRDIKKQLVVSEESLRIYREEVARLPMSDLPKTEFRPTGNFARLRIGRNGTVEERLFIAGTVLPRQIETFRQLLTDLLDAITQDQQITNPITTYKPAVGDKLISEDNKMYEVKRILQEGTIVEVELVGKSTKMYVPTELLPKLFIDARIARREQ